MGREMRLGEMPAYVNDGRKGPALVIVPAIFGIDVSTRSLVDSIGEAGAVTAAVDPFFRVDPGVTDDLERGIARARKVDMPTLRADLAKAFAAARALGTGGVAAVGICFGGKYVLLAAADGHIDAGVTWHGGAMGKHLDVAPRVKRPLWMHFGALDTSIPPEEVEAIRAAFAGNPDVHITVHEGALHGFSHQGSPRYEARAANAGLESVQTALQGLRKP